MYIYKYNNNYYIIAIHIYMLILKIFFIIYKFIYLIYIHIYIYIFLKKKKKKKNIKNKLIICKGYANSSIEGCVALEFLDTSEESQKRKYAFKCHREIIDGISHVYPVNALSFHPM